MSKVYIVTDFPEVYEEGVIMDICDTMEEAEKTKALFPKAQITEQETNRWRNHPVGKYYELSFELFEDDTEISTLSHICNPCPCCPQQFSFSGDLNDDLCYYVGTVVFIRDGDILADRIQQTEKFVKEHIFDKKLTAQKAEELYAKQSYE